jgi:hypothetical protein
MRRQGSSGISRSDSLSGSKVVYAKAGLPARFHRDRIDPPKVHGGKIVGVEEGVEGERLFLFSFKILYPWDGSEEIVDIAVDGNEARRMKIELDSAFPLPTSGIPDVWRELLCIAEEEAGKAALERARWWEELAERRLSEDLSNLFLYYNGIGTGEVLERKAKEMMDFWTWRISISWLGLLELIRPKYRIRIYLSSFSGDLKLEISQDLYSGEIRYPSCGRCGKALYEEVYVARDEPIPLCRDCSLICPSCNHVVGLDSTGICHLCGDRFCSECLVRCPYCGKDVCPTCSGRCWICGAVLCRGCLRHCGICGRGICPDHILSCVSCGKEVCPDCRFLCSRCGEAICKEHARSCSICGQVFCDGCMATCDICGRDVCVFHINTCPICKRYICDECWDGHEGRERM